MERRLAAILAADMVGYTRLMGADEAGTLRRSTDLREKVLEPLIAEHHGRIVKLMGDGLLVEFSSVVEAIACAVTWQERVAEHEAEGDEENLFGQILRASGGGGELEGRLSPEDFKRILADAYYGPGGGQQ